MKTIRKKWQKWFAIPLAAVLVAGTVLGVQMTRPAETAYASTVAVTGTTLTGQDTTDNFTYVQFDIGWEYSWRDAINYDAVWVFVKYRVDGGDWAHATLSDNATDHSVTDNNTVAVTIAATANGTGVFMYRTAGGDGSIDWGGVKLKWEYGTDNVADTALVEGKVFAIEMVYIPQGVFWLGDANNSDSNAFFRADGTYMDDEALGPYQVTSEGEITVGTVDGNLWYDQDNTAADAGDRVSPIPADFPKGYDAIYSMKYEVSQRQYAEFLNTITIAQALARYPGSLATSGQNIELVGSVYGNDASVNDILNESNDGEWVAATFLSWADGVAYADWAGLRPMTEFEFEKTCRGTQAVADDEFPWGTTTIVQATGETGDLQATEVATGTGNPNANYASGRTRPLRNGAFTTATDTREEAGASYYGVMEMAGNLQERTVTMGDSTGRDFTGLHGDGALTTAGDADAINWPGTDAIGAGFRGGGWSTAVATLHISDRTNAATVDATRLNDSGFRAVRTAP